MEFPIEPKCQPSLTTSVRRGAGLTPPSLCVHGGWFGVDSFTNADTSPWLWRLGKPHHGLEEVSRQAAQRDQM